MTAASWVIAGVTFFALGLILTALLRSDAGKNPFPLAEMLAWSQMQLVTGAQCARQRVSKTDFSPLLELRLGLTGMLSKAKTKGLPRSIVTDIPRYRPR